MRKVLESLKKTIKSFGEAGKLDKLMEYLGDQLRELKETNKNQNDYFESLTTRLAEI